MGVGSHGRSSGPAALTTVTLPNKPGIYALVLHLRQDHELLVGKLGLFSFPAGYYLYLGSAQGPGGLKSRISRHCKPEKKRHWHIDYFREIACLEQVWMLETNKALECQLAAGAAKIDGAGIPAPRLGAMDCRCPTHLFHYRTRPSLSNLASLAGIKSPVDDPHLTTFLIVNPEQDPDLRLPQRCR